MKISIIIPIYNAEKYIRKCIESMINQTYQNIEIILINDGSTDNSLEICQEYQKKDKRIKIVNEKNQGVSAARNKGIEESTGDYITFVDADDTINEKTIEELIKIIIKYQPDLIKYSYFRTIGKFKIKYTFERLGNKVFNVKEYVLKIYPQISKIAPFSSVCNLVLKNSIAKNVKLDETLKYAEDLKYTYDVIKNSNSVFFSNKCFYHYIDNPNSATKNINQEMLIKKLEDSIESYEYLVKQIKDEAGVSINFDKRIFTQICEILYFLEVKNKKQYLQAFGKIKIEKLQKYQTSRYYQNYKRYYIRRNINKTIKKLLIKL